ncbi:hypothetical protein ElyMa_005695700 [Elysia marginata]|uniref:Uncharacterized protein n=1 Tax=Elysia marginata TaxID=1093978 RepID=A0AAV4FH68_9GAST|nr:hypothetical protein ElyMa_005695700 [Elysia marginata]
MTAIKMIILSMPTRASTCERLMTATLGTSQGHLGTSRERGKGSKLRQMAAVIQTGQVLRKPVEFSPLPPSTICIRLGYSGPVFDFFFFLRLCFSKALLAENHRFQFSLKEV